MWFLACSSLCVKGVAMFEAAPHTDCIDRLAQASGGRVDRVADGFAGDEKFHSPVLLTTCGVIVGGYRQGVAETSGGNRIRRDSLLHQVVAHRAGTILRQRLVHGIAADIVRIAADFNVESRVGEQDSGDFRQFLARSRLQRILSRCQTEHRTC